MFYDFHIYFLVREINLVTGSHRSRLVLDNLLDGWSLVQTLVPSIVIGVVLLQFEAGSIITENEINHQVPGHEGEISDRTIHFLSVQSLHNKEQRHLPLVTNQPLLSLQRFVQDVEHPFHLIEVSLLGTGKLLMVELGEPGSLAKVWTLSTHLEVQPLADVEPVDYSQYQSSRLSGETSEPFRGGCVCEGRGFIIGLHKVFDDSARLP